MNIKVNHNPTGRETFEFLSEEFEENVNLYNRAVEIGDIKGQTIYFSKASILEDLIVNLFDATVPSWYSIDVSQCEAKAGDEDSFSNLGL